MPKALSTILSVTLLAALPAAAHHLPAGPLGHLLTPAEIAHYLDLDEAQRVAVEELSIALHEALAPLAAERQVLAEELATLLAEDEPDLEAIGALVVALDQNRQSVVELHEGFEDDLRALLDDGQSLALDHLEEIVRLLRNRPEPPPSE